MTSRFARPVEIIAPTRRQTRMEIRIHSAPALQPQDFTSTEGIPTTSVARTLLDFAAVDPWFIGKAVENAYRLDLLDLAAIDSLISRSQGFRGVARLSEALTVYRIPGFTRSDFERFFLAMSRSQAMPQPSMNFVAAGYELDAYWPAERFAVELDTYEYHGSPAAFERDRKRQEDLKLAGIEIVRITGTRFEREPKAVANRIRQLLHQRHLDLKRTSPKTPH